jgi:hypothetical protein
MVNSLMPYGKKMFSLALTFNAILTFVYGIEILAGFYASYPYWKPFPPFIFDGSLFWVIIPASIINFFPAVSTGKVETGRIWFHHYVYGFIVAIISTTSLMLFTSVPLLSLFTTNITDVNVNIGRFFILGGLTLVLDDLSDVSGIFSRLLRFLKLKAYQNRRTVHFLQLIMGFVSLYFSLAVSANLALRPEEVTLANVILIGTLLVTSLTAFGSVKRKIWLNIKPEED